MSNHIPKKVLIISSLYMPHLGGVEKYSQNLAYALSNDFDVHVFCMNTEKQPALRQDRSVTVHSLPCHSLFKGRLPVPGRGATAELARFLKDNPVAFAIIQTRLYPFNFEAAELLQYHDVPLIVIEHGTGHVHFNSRHVSHLWHLYEHGNAVRWKRLCDSFYGVSDASARWLKHFGITAKGVIPNGINPTEFNDIPADWRSALGVSEDAILITFAGRILEEKGTVDLLRAFDLLNDPRVHVVVAGDGDMSLLDRWRENPNVHLLGRVVHSELLMILKDSQIFCLPTAYPEGLPTVVLEAGAFGVPVVATDRGGIIEVVHHEQSGIIVPARDVDALKEALAKLVSSPDLRYQYGRALRENIYARYTWDHSGKIVAGIISAHQIKEIHSA